MKTFIVLLFVVSIVKSYGLECHGTEPFWSASIKEKSIDFRIDGQTESLDFDKVKNPIGFDEDYLKVFLKGYQILAIVKKQRCTDESSRIYSREGMFFLGDKMFYGCCGIGERE